MTYAFAIGEADLDCHTDPENNTRNEWESMEVFREDDGRSQARNGEVETGR
jgi:hypothetical protein